MPKEEFLKILHDRIPKQFNFAEKLLDSIYENSETISEALETCDEICAELKENDEMKAELENYKKIKEKNKNENMV